MDRNEAIAALANQCVKCGQNHPAASNSRPADQAVVTGTVEFIYTVNYFVGKLKYSEYPDGTEK
jgi:hypothetical protein